ncbi:MAG: hypothetical protein WA705_03740 [Candidatus Ozemobacteraceae bacterium]
MTRLGHSVKQLLMFMLIAALCTIHSMPVSAQNHLDNPIKPVFGKGFYLTLLGTRTFGNDEIRSFKKLVTNLHDVEKKVLKWGISLNRKVRIMLYTDTGFLCGDIWIAAGLQSNNASLDQFSEDNSLLFATISDEELARQLDLLGEKWFFVKPINPAYAAHPDDVKGALLDQVLAQIKEMRTRMGKTLKMPISENLRDYQIFEDVGYDFPLSIIWVPIPRPGARLGRCLLVSSGNWEFILHWLHVLPRITTFLKFLMQRLLRKCWAELLVLILVPSFG